MNGDSNITQWDNGDNCKPLYLDISLWDPL